MVTKVDLYNESILRSGTRKLYVYKAYVNLKINSTVFSPGLLS